MSQKDVTLVVGEDLWLSLWHDEQDRAYIVSDGRQQSPYYHRSEDALEQSDFPDQTTALRAALAEFGLVARTKALADILTAQEANDRILRVRLFVLSIDEYLEEIGSRQVAISIEVEPQIQANTSLTNEAKRKAARIALLKENREYCSLCEIEDLLARIKAEQAIALEWLEKRFRLLRFDYELELLGHRSGISVPR
jgi:hypothetical protein